MSTLRPAPVASDRFTWDGHMFTAEMSDLHGFGRVYDDAADEGLTLVSSRYPGEQVVFVVERVERDREGDTLYWELGPARNRQPARHPVDFKIRVYND
jgi:hypothetical protein